MKVKITQRWTKNSEEVKFTMTNSSTGSVYAVDAAIDTLTNSDFFQKQIKKFHEGMTTMKFFNTNLRVDISDD